MPRQLGCQQGHQWTSVLDAANAPCPVCGSPAMAGYPRGAAPRLNGSLADASAGDNGALDATLAPSPKHFGGSKKLQPPPPSDDATFAMPAKSSSDHGSETLATPAPRANSPSPALLPPPADLDATVAARPLPADIDPAAITARHQPMASGQPAVPPPPPPSAVSARNLLSAPPRPPTQPDLDDQTAALPGNVVVPSNNDADTLASPMSYSSSATALDPAKGDHNQQPTLPSAPYQGQQGAIPGYEILGVLGRGGMGVVYKARQLALNRITALKMILSGDLAGSEEIGRFRAEAEAVARLQHVNIVQIYEVGERNGLPYFSLEYIDGGSLQGKMGGEPMAPRAAAQMAATLARAVSYAHQRGIVHRDLKPANIMLTSAGEPKITDFGLAKKIGGDAGQTTTGSVLGTPAYMAPEQASGRIHDVGPAADIYSLGALFYDMLCGRPPFRGETIMHTLQLVQTAEPLPPSRLQPRVPPDLETICLKCLNKEPAKRYVDAEALADDLTRYLNNQPILARRTGLVERAWKWARRRPAVAALLATLAIVLVGGFSGMFYLWVHAETAKLDAIEKRQAADEAKKEAIDKGKAAAEAATREENAKNAALEAANSEKEAKLAAVAAAKNEKEAKELAVANYERSRRILYATHMSLAQKALTDAHFDRAQEILEDLKSPREGFADLRGFEWFYLNRVCTSEGLALKSHASMVTAVVFSPKGKMLATASLDRKVQLWDVATGKHRWTLAGHRRPVRSVAFSADESLVVTASADGTAKVWDTADGKLLKTLEGHSDRVLCAAVSKDGKWIATGSEDRTIILWDGATGEKKRVLTGHRYPVATLAFHPDGTRLVSGSEDNLVKLWDLEGSAAPVDFEGHKHWVVYVAFDAAGKRIASASLDQTVIVWDVQKHEPLRVLREAEKPIRQVAFSPAGTQLAAATNDGTLFLWDLTFKSEPRKLPGQPGTLRTIAFSEDGERLATVTFDTRVWDDSASFAEHSGAVTAVAFHPAGKDAASASSALDAKTGQFVGEVKMWDVAKHKGVKSFQGHTGPVRGLAFSPTGFQLATASEDCTVRLWDVESAAAAGILLGHEAWVNAVAFHPDGQLAASVSEDKTVRVWNLKTHTERWPAMADHGRPVRCVAFSPDKKHFATGAAGGKVIVWDVATGKAVRTIKAHEFGVTSVLFSPDGTSLATAGEDQVIRIWSLDGKQKKVDPLELKGHTDTVTGLAFSSDGRRLFSSSADQTVKVWDTYTGEETLTLRGHTGGVTSVALNPGAPKDRLLISGSWDHTVRVWDATDVEVSEVK